MPVGVARKDGHHIGTIHTHHCCLASLKRSLSNSTKALLPTRVGKPVGVAYKDGHTTAKDTLHKALLPTRVGKPVGVAYKDGHTTAKDILL